MTIPMFEDLTGFCRLSFFMNLFLSGPETRATGWRKQMSVKCNLNSINDILEWKQTFKVLDLQKLIFSCFFSTFYYICVIWLAIELFEMILSRVSTNPSTRWMNNVDSILSIYCRVMNFLWIHIVLIWISEAIFPGVGRKKHYRLHNLRQWSELTTSQLLRNAAKKIWIAMLMPMSAAVTWRRKKEIFLIEKNQYR